MKDGIEISGLSKWLKLSCVTAPPLTKTPAMSTIPSFSLCCAPVPSRSKTTYSQSVHFFVYSLVSIFILLWFCIADGCSTVLVLQMRVFYIPNLKSKRVLQVIPLFFTQTNCLYMPIANLKHSIIAVALKELGEFFFRRFFVRLRATRNLISRTDVTNIGNSVMTVVIRFVVRESNGA